MTYAVSNETTADSLNTILEVLLIVQRDFVLASQEYSTHHSLVKLAYNTFVYQKPKLLTYQ